MKYGTLPNNIGTVTVDPVEMFFYQYLPIKMAGNVDPTYEPRLKWLDEITGKVCCDFIGEFGLNAFVDSYIYLTAKNMYQDIGCAFNRPGYHSDGFLTPDVNYIWYNSVPTIFNTSEFKLTIDDQISLTEMEEQALPENDITFPSYSVLRLNQYNIHRLAFPESAGVRAFVKMSFSGDRYDLRGNSHNYLIDYHWPMRRRTATRNIPQNPGNFS